MSEQHLKTFLTNDTRLIFSLLERINHMTQGEFVHKPQRVLPDLGMLLHEVQRQGEIKYDKFKILWQRYFREGLESYCLYDILIDLFPNAKGMIVSLVDGKMLTFIAPLYAKNETLKGQLIQYVESLMEDEHALIQLYTFYSDEKDFHLKKVRINAYNKIKKTTIEEIDSFCLRQKDILHNLDSGFYKN